MACDRCHDLCVTYPIRTPGELRNAVEIVYASVHDGTLKEVGVARSVLEPGATFSTVATGEVLPDVLNFHFECASCREHFALEAETFHGSGGAWSPVRPEAIRERL